MMPETIPETIPETMSETMSKSRQVAYSMGGLGWQITNTLVVSVGVYYSLPPDGSGLETQLSKSIPCEAPAFQRSR
jgi:hypothetical protein